MIHNIHKLFRELDTSGLHFCVLHSFSERAEMIYSMNIKIKTPSEDYIAVVKENN